MSVARVEILSSNATKKRWPNIAHAAIVQCVDLLGSIKRVNRARILGALGSSDTGVSGLLFTRLLL